MVQYSGLYGFDPLKRSPLYWTFSQTRKTCAHLISDITSDYYQYETWGKHFTHAAAFKSTTKHTFNTRTIPPQIAAIMIYTIKTCSLSALTVLSMYKLAINSPPNPTIKRLPKERVRYLHQTRFFSRARGLFRNTKLLFFKSHEFLNPSNP